ncbi:hypothetical protein KUTeg_009972 [Tegillarca granosa]|uniref:carbonic anhydrase n=1 Tax=Tegillarca granosa TaxID=220873 RepID=A0ABQ9F5J9_TEGGR|nr:hypothetical protein KUTeg_009972 [Tegillarca granosa]
MIITITNYYGNEWDYEGEHGPDRWYLDFPKCAGTHQSPISIKTNQVKYDPRLQKIKLHDFDNIFNANMSLKNNGHTVQVDLNDQNMTVTGGGLPGKYKAQQFHFHWGSEDRRGSEHDFNGIHYPMEMHIVHYLESYGNITEAMDKEHGLMVLAFMFEFVLIDDHVNIPSVPLSSLIPDTSHLDHFYRYDGSLTTPPCFESVIWTVFKKTIRVTESQINAFRHKVKKTANGEPERDLTDDFRPPQPINDRVVFSSKPEKQYIDNNTNSANIQSVNSLTIVSLLLSSLYSLYHSR